ncbi:hypothetical protein, partial [Streptomyces sp. FxanaA7]|uniref:hypothetical protein n=1 Tax=Streptomyces sp. FxanaA7 TaxID=1265492 RepID=UPI001F32ED5E
TQISRRCDTSEPPTHHDDIEFTHFSSPRIEHPSGANAGLSGPVRDAGHILSAKKLPQRQ